MDTLNSLEYSQTMVKEFKPNVIEVDVAFYHPNNNETIKVYDIEGMTQEFDNKLQQIINQD